MQFQMCVYMCISVCTILVCKFIVGVSPSAGNEMGAEMMGRGHERFLRIQNLGVQFSHCLWACWEADQGGWGVSKG